MTVRWNRNRGVMTLNWLDARLSFSFGPYRNADWNSFGPVVALNEDRVQPGQGFAMHSHEDVEILMFPLHGLIEHRDSLGNHTIVRPKEVLMMRAGSGIAHSQFNPSSTETDHHLQLWIRPRQRGLTPFTERRHFLLADDGWTPIALDVANARAFEIDQACRVMWGNLTTVSSSLDITIGIQEGVYLHVIVGTCSLVVGDRSEILSVGEAVAVAALGGRVEVRAVHGTASLLMIHFDAQ